MIDIPSPWNNDNNCRSDTCRLVEEQLDKIADKGWILVSTQIIEHCSEGYKRVLLATFRQGKPR